MQLFIYVKLIAVYCYNELLNTKITIDSDL